ncbi:LuxR family transcriptional regulator [Arthrobacter sp. Br18]|uniref:LuxR family transcriptional regulator n=1 Tax=Arthrobacter sp. Br18 TaxID=1312954 RepID=UPI00047D4C89|nr:LuxR family transcriptional regulator [Arthrobacter sp. Br18]
MDTEISALMLSSGRAAYARGEWRSAYEALRGAAPVSMLDIEDLEALASSAWWLGLVKENFELSEEVFRQLCAGGSNAKAAMKALQLALLWVLRGDLMVGSGWLSRVRRILRDVPQCPAHGYLLYLDSMIELEFSGVLPTPSCAAELREMGRGFDEPALTSLGLVLGGLADLRGGNTAEGFAQLDEAMLPVLADRIPLEWAGDIYCTVIHVCHELADVDRMRAWTEATERWCLRFGTAVVYSGVCRVHRLELKSIEGDWPDVERLIELESADLADKNVWAAGEGFYQLGELRRLRGEDEGARAAYGRARRLGIDPQPGEALLASAGGHAEEGWLALTAALGGRDRVGRARLLGAAVELALSTGRTVEAEKLSRELEGTARDYASPGFGAWSAQARGLLHLHRAEAAEALQEFEAASRFHSGIRPRYDTARLHVLQAQALEALGRADTAAWNSATARATFKELGAQSYPFPPSPAPPETAPGGLTPREKEVLAAVTSGTSNRDVARLLFISEKTVGRHLANIFVKIGVTSRTAAAAWARDQS